MGGGVRSTLDFAEAELGFSCLALRVMLDDAFPYAVLTLHLL